MRYFSKLSIFLSFLDYFFEFFSRLITLSGEIEFRSRTLSFGRVLNARAGDKEQHNLY